MAHRLILVCCHVRRRLRACSRRASLSSIAVDGAGDAAVAQHHGAVADLDDLLGIGRNQQDGAAGVGEFGPDALDLGARADIDAARRIDQQQDADARGQPARHLHLLLVAAAQRADEHVDIAGLDLQPVEQIDHLAPRRKYPSTKPCRLSASRSARMALS